MPITKRQAADVQNAAMAQAQGRSIGGITPEGVIEITENGLFDVAQYAQANVNVSGGAGPQIAAGTVTVADGTTPFIKVTGLEFTPKAFIVLNTFNNGNHACTQGCSFINGVKSIYRTNSAGVPSYTTITGTTISEGIFPTYTPEDDGKTWDSYSNSPDAAHLLQSGFALQAYNGSFPFVAGDVYNYWAIG